MIEGATCHPGRDLSCTPNSLVMGALHSLLVVHSFLRWLVLVSLVYAIVNAFIKWRSGASYLKGDNQSRVAAVVVAHIQLVIGLSLYFISPIVNYFWRNFSTTVHERQVRFFGMEHIAVMIAAVTVLTIGSAKAKRKATDAQKHKAVYIWFTIALLLILSSIPWAFSPLVSRPWVRW